MIPGELFIDSDDLVLNAGRACVTLAVANTNAALAFDRGKARGFRLNIPAGSAVRFEPGQKRTVELVALAGDRIVFGFTGAVMGPLDKVTGKVKAVKKVKATVAKRGSKR